MGRRICLEIRKLVLKHFKNGKSQREIADIVGVTRPSVQNIIKRYVHENRVENKSRKAPNKIFNDTDERWILKQIKKDPKISAPKLTVQVQKCLKKNCNPETVRRVLRNAGFNGRTARNKPFINEKNRKKRLQFAKEHLNEPDSFWNNVIFADESKFNIHGSDGKIFLWRQANTELKPKNLRGTVKHGGGHVMVWGCMAAAGIGKLMFIDGNLDKHQYLKILQENLKQFAENINIAEEFRYYQDKDPKHKSGLVQTWLIWNCPHVMQPPAQSPDLNVIENLWSQLEKAVRNHDIHDLECLKRVLQEEWSKISSEYTKKLFASMKNRLKCVIEQKGYPTKY